MFTVIVDTKEKQPWTFSSLVDTQNKGLKTGDYTIEGLEDILCIERKKSVSELAINITKPRFKRELERMQNILHSFLICEFDINDILQYPAGSLIPKSKWNQLRVRGPFILSSIARIQVFYGIHVLLCGDADNAKLIALNIMKQTYGKCTKETVT